ncbi:PE-PGRS family protein [Streptomyces himastatinicus ATCC 53653]|uniref:PE-PGRS family protein n=1 Tax=Streptomyces himastatinicus ATCC 53653 TaxID=457427 RepID=D9WT07_9ACTN|nr:hypothetical protein [Streptomyces himastatinicus]EFL24282.1 PE-PGRS family protein [Streptomyces himastatinicus ATCC 53653]
MKLRTRLLTSSALWSAPLWLGITVFFYIRGLHAPNGGLTYLKRDPDQYWAPSVVAAAVDFFYSLSYAIAAGLGAWEGGRLKQDGVWGLAPARSRYHIAAQVLVPVVVVGSLLLVVPAAVALAEFGVAPTVPSVLPVLAGILIVCAYAVIGFAVGSLAPRSIAAPLLTALVWYLVAWSVTYSDPAWPRYVFGQGQEVGYGQVLSPEALAIPVLFAGSVAGVVAVWWVRSGPPLVRTALRTAMAAGCAFAMTFCASTTNDWLTGTPSSYGTAAETCAGRQPRVCMARDGGAANRIGEVRRALVSSSAALRNAGVEVSMPARVRDALGQRGKASTEKVWWLPLTKQAGKGGGGMPYVRYAVVLAAVEFPCRLPSSFGEAKTMDYIVNADAAKLWAAYVAGAQRPFLAWRKSQYIEIENADEVLAKVKERARAARELPPEEQSAWYDAERAKACRLASGTGTS